MVATENRYRCQLDRLKKSCCGIAKRSAKGWASRRWSLRGNCCVCKAKGKRAEVKNNATKQAVSVLGDCANAEGQLMDRNWVASSWGRGVKQSGGGEERAGVVVVKFGELVEAYFSRIRRVSGWCGACLARFGRDCVQPFFPMENLLVMQHIHRCLFSTPLARPPFCLTASLMPDDLLK